MPISPEKVLIFLNWDRFEEKKMCLDFRIQENEWKKANFSELSKN